MLLEDPSVFLADWGEAATIDGTPVVGIFAEPYAADPLGTAGISTSAPRFLLPAASVPARGDTDPVLELTDRALHPVSFRYLVGETMPDGTGWTTLILSLHPSQAPAELDIDLSEPWPGSEEGEGAAP